LVCRQWMRFQKHYVFNVDYEYMIVKTAKDGITFM
jgi:hypothetical protein